MTGLDVFYRINTLKENLESLSRKFIACQSVSYHIGAARIQKEMNDITLEIKELKDKLSKMEIYT